MKISKSLMLGCAALIGVSVMSGPNTAWASCKSWDAVCKTKEAAKKVAEAADRARQEAAAAAQRAEAAAREAAQRAAEEAKATEEKARQAAAAAQEAARKVAEAAAAEAERLAKVAEEKALAEAAEIKRLADAARAESEKLAKEAAAATSAAAKKVAEEAAAAAKAAEAEANKIVSDVAKKVDSAAKETKRVAKQAKDAIAAGKREAKRIAARAEKEAKRLTGKGESVACGWQTKSITVVNADITNITGKDDRPLPPAILAKIPEFQQLTAGPDNKPREEMQKALKGAHLAVIFEARTNEVLFDKKCSGAIDGIKKELPDTHTIEQKKTENGVTIEYSVDIAIEWQKVDKMGCVALGRTGFGGAGFKDNLCSYMKSDSVAMFTKLNADKPTTVEEKQKALNDFKLVKGAVQGLYDDKKAIVKKSAAKKRDNMVKQICDLGSKIPAQNLLCKKK